ncbi:hypothetical protein CSHISOI_02429 [Colletotrichum shisoi]|uniref:Uncharacterized protein n=1 Tax=Colletotrichum shisoi TaxID=2078593 RepID=A0A5Q4C2Z9_9PEZI|nr:hypothetical protein CSHISOI_02429 [Colletotrichum shisoi]
MRGAMQLGIFRGFQSREQCRSGRAEAIESGMFRHVVLVLDYGQNADGHRGLVEKGLRG